MAAEIYLVEGGTLFAVRSDGAYRSLSAGWGVVHSLALTTGRIWAMQQETIFLVDPAGGGDQVHSRGWGSGVKRLAATGDRVLLIDGRGRLFALELTGTYRYLSDGWEGVTAFCGTNGRFFAIDQGRLFEVFPDTGGNRFLSDGWGDVTACAGLAGQLYLVAKPGGTLFTADPDTGADRAVSREWLVTSLLLPCVDKLVALDGSILYEITPDDGSFRQIGEGWGEAQAGIGPES